MYGMSAALQILKDMKSYIAKVNNTDFGSISSIVYMK